MLLARLRWSAFGLRGRIVGAVVVTAAISLGVAALVLLPRLENSLQERVADDARASEVQQPQRQERAARRIAEIQYYG